MGRKFNICRSSKPERVDETMCMEKAGKVGGGDHMERDMGHFFIKR